MLARDDFQCIGREGIGNPRSQVAHSMAYFNGMLYLGVTHPKGDGPEDAARILRYHVDSDSWEQVHCSPLVAADEKANARDVYGTGGQAMNRQREPEHDMVPRDRGYRRMLVSTGADGRSPALYVTTLSHWGSCILYSEDGETFEPITEPGLGNANVLSFRAVEFFQDRLFIAPAGTVEGEAMDRNFGDVATLYAADDPQSGRWEEVMEPGFGDPDNKSVFAMAEFNGLLYAGTGNPERGFQIWKTDAKGKAPYRWECVITDGAGRYNFNETATTMVVFDGALYVGSGIPGLGYDKANDVGPAAAELIRIHPDDSWDLLVGTPRFTRDGLKVPLAGMGPGCDDFFNSVFWSMAVHEGCLYVGTHHWESWQVALSGAPEMRGGFQLLASRDGEDWETLTLDGFGDAFSHGVRTLFSTPDGLYLGTSTHREIEKIWFRRRRMAGETGVGGLSIWRGSR